MSLPMHLRNYKEKSKDEQSRDFFNVPTWDAVPTPNEEPVTTKPRGSKEGSSSGGLQGMDINAVLSVEGKEEVYVSGSKNRDWSTCAEHT